MRFPEIFGNCRARESSALLKLFSRIINGKHNLPISNGRFHFSATFRCVRLSFQFEPLTHFVKVSPVNFRIVTVFVKNVRLQRLVADESAVRDCVFVYAPIWRFSWFCVGSCFENKKAEMQFEPFVRGGVNIVVKSLQKRMRCLCLRKSWKLCSLISENGTWKKNENNTQTRFQNTRHSYVRIIHAISDDPYYWHLFFFSKMRNF